MVGPVVARRIATRLSVGNADREEQIYSALMATRGLERMRIASVEQKQVGLFVEFRESPVMSHSREGQRTTRGMAEWLNAGLSYAMMLPQEPESEFLSPKAKAVEEGAARKKSGAAEGSSTDAGAAPPGMRRFLKQVGENVIDSYLKLRVKAMEQLVARFRGTPDRILPEAEKLESRLKLFVLSESGLGDFPAVCFRLYLKAEDGGHVRCYWDQDSEAEPRVRVKEMAENPDEIRAIEERFYPVLQYYDRHQRFPDSNEDLHTFGRWLANLENTTKGSAAVDRWRLYPADRDCRFRPLEDLIHTIVSNQLLETSPT